MPSMDEKTMIDIVKITAKDAAPIYPVLVRIETGKFIKLWRKLYSIFKNDKDGSKLAKLLKHLKLSEDTLEKIPWVPGSYTIYYGVESSVPMPFRVIRV